MFLSEVDCTHKCLFGNRENNVVGVIKHKTPINRGFMLEIARILAINSLFYLGEPAL